MIDCNIFTQYEEKLILNCSVELRTGFSIVNTVHILIIFVIFRQRRLVILMRSVLL